MNIKKIVVINNNIFENVSKKKQKEMLKDYMKKNIKGKDYFIGSQKVIINKYSIGKLLYGETLYDVRIDKKIRFEIKANIIANLEEVIRESEIYQKDRKDLKNHIFANYFERRKCVVKYKGNIYKIMFEIGKKNEKNTLYGIEHIKK